MPAKESLTEVEKPASQGHTKKRLDDTCIKKASQEALPENSNDGKELTFSLQQTSSVDSKRPRDEVYNIDEAFDIGRIKGLSFEGSYYKIGSWVSALVKLCSLL